MKDTSDLELFHSEVFFPMRTSNPVIFKLHLSLNEAHSVVLELASSSFDQHLHCT